MLEEPPGAPSPTPAPLRTPLPIPAFGRILLERGLATRDDIKRCLEIQRRRARVGDFRRLGEILLEERILTLGQVLEVLGAQRIALLVCPRCAARYNVMNWDSKRRYRCRKCRDVLERPESIHSVSIEDTLDIEQLEQNEPPIVEWPTPSSPKSKLTPIIEEIDDAPGEGNGDGEGVGDAVATASASSSGSAASSDYEVLSEEDAAKIDTGAIELGKLIAATDDDDEPTARTEAPVDEPATPSGVSTTSRARMARFGDGAALEVPAGATSRRRRMGIDDEPDPFMESPTALLGDQIDVERHPRLGPYEIMGEIGRGGMGVIYKAIHTKLKRVVALKVLSPGRDPLKEDIERFQVEARAVAKLRHPHIVAIHEVDEIDGVHFFAMDFVEGVPFARMIDRGALTASEACEVILPIAYALHYAHSRGIVHRDIKPSNIIIDLEGKPFLVDFGIAKIKSDDICLTAGHEILGSAPYMAPEYIEGESARYDERCDVYALGVVLYEALTGVRPHEDTDTVRLLRKILYTEPLPVNTRRPDLDPRLASIVEMSIHRDPVRRYPTAMAFANDLRRFLSGEAPQARRRVLPGLRTVRTHLMKRRSGLVTVLAAVVALLVGAAASWGLGLLVDGEAGDAPSSVTRTGMASELVTRARSLETGGDDDGALLTYGLAIELDPDGAAEAYARRGLLLLRLGRADQGRRDLDTAEALSPDIVKSVKEREAADER